MSNPRNGTKLRIKQGAFGEARGYIGEVVVVDDSDVDWLEGCVMVAAEDGARFPVSNKEWEVVE